MFLSNKCVGSYCIHSPVSVCQVEGKATPPASPSYRRGSVTTPLGSMDPSSSIRVPSNLLDSLSSSPVSGSDKERSSLTLKSPEAHHAKGKVSQDMRQASATDNLMNARPSIDQRVKKYLSTCWVCLVPVLLL